MEIMPSANECLYCYSTNLVDLTLGEVFECTNVLKRLVRERERERECVGVYVFVKPRR